MRSRREARWRRGGDFIQGYIIFGRSVYVCPTDYQTWTWTDHHPGGRAAIWRFRELDKKKGRLKIMFFQMRQQSAISHVSSSREQQHT